MSVESDDLVRLTRDGSVATIWLDRPSKRNAMNYAMWATVEQFALRLGSDSQVRVVVLRGAGDHFCSGADITELSISRAPGERSFSEVVAAAETALANMPKPTIAFIAGDCIGGGCSLAIDCDTRIATADARFGITPAKLGVVYPPGALERIAHLVGPAVTKRLLFTGDLIAADEALRVGLIDEIVDAAAGEGRLATFTSVLASRSLLTQAATKSMVADVASHGEVSPAVQRHWAALAADAPDLAEGVAAFVEKRPPRFTWSGDGQ